MNDTPIMLTAAQRRALLAKAHHLHPVVLVGRQGVTPAVMREIDIALKAHELIKVRMAGGERAERDALAAGICDALACALVQRLGKLLVLWRPRPEEAVRAQPRHARAKPKPDRARKLPRANAGAGLRQRRATTAPPPEAAGVGRPRRRRAEAASAPSGVPRASAPRRRRSP